MTRLERYKERLDRMTEKRSELLRRGRFIEANELNAEIREVELLTKQAEEFEEVRRPRPIKELVTKQELHEMGIIPLMIECHLAADFLTGLSYMIVDICKKHGFTDVRLMPEIRELLEKCEKFASALAEMSPELKDLIVNNETLNDALHKKCLGYIKQRLK